MRFELPWYDINYRDASDYNTPAGKLIARLNTYLRDNWIEWWIACLDEKGNTVSRYTNRVALQISDSASQEQLEKIQDIVLQLLKTMWGTENQLREVFSKDSHQIIEIQWTETKRRFSLPWYDTSYRDANDYNTSAGKLIARLNTYLRDNWIEWWIACLDEKGNTVSRYTDQVVLEIDNSISQEQLEHIKQIASELLSIMQS